MSTLVVETAGVGLARELKLRQAGPDVTDELADDTVGHKSPLSARSRR